MAVSLRFVCLVACAEASRRVRWYLAGGRAAANEAFVEKYANAITGVYGCCNMLSVAADGSVTIKPNLQSDAAPMLAKGLTYHVVAGVSGDGILSGGAKAAAADVAKAVRDANLTGIIFDYEPASNYTKEHEQAYASFLKAIKDAAGSSFEVGMDTAGWGILKDLSAYAPANLDLYTSMTPTYNAPAALSPTGKQFVKDMVSTFGSGAAALGMGSMPAPGFEEKCANMPDYGWSNDTMTEFLTMAADDGVEDVDIWRCDIDHYGETPQWYFDALASFLQGGQAVQAPLLV
eukprot:TRINITY_DN74820_c0_g1_i1.p1 TRINITY_DN74820_c0_g1~~TRINITY_DN74820_c0_g1_i1.p1  ORF type:complete len:307 (-),score=53.58 TRINITY_DN74820_c0_g1_i1:158-1027(-)